MTLAPSPLTPEDLRTLAARGIDRAEAERQLEVLRHPPEPATVLGPCTLEGGIIRLRSTDEEGLLEPWRQAATAGRISKFVPASGAATRMFRDLLDGGPEVERFFESRGRFAFANELARLVDEGVSSEAEPARWARALLDPTGLGYGGLPKALVHFHAYAEGPRTAFEEQIVEAAGYCVSSSPTGAPLATHFTISPEHEALFARAAVQAEARLEARLGSPLDISFSSQSPATDTLCVHPDGTPFRRDDGALLLRPAGHGALLPNLEALGGDIVVVKNIDNILPERSQATVTQWKRLLVGLLVKTEAALSQVARDLEQAAVAEDQAIEQVARILALHPDDRPSDEAADWLRQSLSRPLRVCGMVRNDGEPGGGPFWVPGLDGRPSRQIVEASQADHADPGQADLWQRATHFNPVDLVCSLRDRSGDPHHLARYVDPATAFVSTKSHEGRELRALERPGLWNGAMAGWNTLFVEVPSETFGPVKTIFDLLRAEHVG